MDGNIGVGILGIGENFTFRISLHGIQFKLSYCLHKVTLGVGKTIIIKKYQKVIRAEVCICCKITQVYVWCWCFFEVFPVGLYEHFSFVSVYY